MVESLLLDFLPQDFVKYFDFKTLTPARASFVRDDMKQLHSDVIWQLNWRGRRSILVILLEFQSADDYWMSARIHAYAGNFWLDYIKTHELKSGDLLPAIFPVVLYNGKRPWQSPTSMRDLLDLPYAQFMPSEYGQTYHVIDARRVPPDLLAKAKGDAAYVIRGEQAQTGNALAALGEEFIARHLEPEKANLDKAVVAWLEKRIAKVEPAWRSRKDKEQPGMLMELLEKAQAEVQKYKQEALTKGLAEGRAEGRLEGRAEGRLEGKAEGLAEGKAEGLAEGKAEGLAAGKAEAMSCQRAGLLAMLALKFGEIPAAWRDAVARLNDPGQITNLTIAILKAQSQAEYEHLLFAENQS